MPPDEPLAIYPFWLLPFGSTSCSIESGWPDAPTFPYPLLLESMAELYPAEPLTFIEPPP